MATFNRKSWHYRLVSGYSVFEDHNVTDICSYTRAVICGALWALLIAVIAGCVLASLVRFIMYLTVIAIYGYFPMDSIAMTGAALVLIGAVVGLAVLRHQYRLTHPRRQSVFAEMKDRVFDSFISTAWEKFHDRTCFQIDLDGEGQLLPRDRKPWAKVVGAAIAVAILAIALYVRVH